MASVEIIDTDYRTVRLIHRPDSHDRKAPVRTHANEIRWIAWGGFVRLDRARQQLCPCPVLIEVVGWSAGVVYGEYHRLDDDEYLQGCLVRSVRGELTVYGVLMGSRPRIVRAPGRKRITRLPPLGSLSTDSLKPRQRQPHQGKDPLPDPHPYGAELTDDEWFSAMQGSRLHD